jgi:hypothetical protein
MNTNTPDAASRTTASVRRLGQGDLELTILGLRGIFWALNMLVVHNAADDIAHKGDLDNGISNLIIAGELLATETAERF